MEDRRGKYEGRGRSSHLLGIQEIEKKYEVLDNVSFETMASELGLKPPATAFTVQDLTKTTFIGDKRSVTDLEVEELIVNVDGENGLIWFGGGVKIGTLRLDLDHDSVAIIDSHAQIRIIKVTQYHGSLLVIGSGVHVVKGEMDHGSYLLHTINTSVGFETIDYGSEVIKYGSNIYKPDLKSLRLTEQLDQLQDAQRDLEETIKRKTRIIAELQGLSSKAK